MTPLPLASPRRNRVSSAERAGEARSGISDRAAARAGTCARCFKKEPRSESLREGAPGRGFREMVPDESPVSTGYVCAYDASPGRVRAGARTTLFSRKARTVMKDGLTRRRFLGGAVRTATTAALAPAVFTRGFLGAQSPNERIVTGHIGVGGMGSGHLNGLKENCGAICDVYEPHLQRAAGAVGRYVPLYKDFRELLDQRDVDAVFIATPDHWHGVMSIYACEAGKDVYVQKPASVTIEEGRKMVEAAHRCGRVVQVGSQGRSTEAAYKACRYIRNGMLGKVKEVACWHYPNPVGGFKPDTDPPATLDWDLWLGPVRYVPYNEDRCHFNFRWFLEFGGGQIRDRGAHVMSVAMWCMNADATGPVSIKATGTSPREGIWDCPVDMEVEYIFKNPDWTLWWRQ